MRYLCDFFVQGKKNANFKTVIIWVEPDAVMNADSGGSKYTKTEDWKGLGKSSNFSDVAASRSSQMRQSYIKT